MSRLAAALDEMAVQTATLREAGVVVDRLLSAYAFAERSCEDSSLSVVTGKAAINNSIAATFDALRPRELLTAQPHGPRIVHSMIHPHMQRHRQVIDSGGQMRTLYQSSARWHPYTREMVAVMTDLGVAVRTLPQPFPRMIIMDRSVAFLPTQSLEDVLLDRSASMLEAPGYQSSLVVRHPVIVGHLADAFEGLWAHGREWDGSAPLGEVDLEESEVLILRYLDQTLTVEEIAVRLGTSTRTVKRRIERIKEKFGVRTYYGLGRRWQAMQLAGTP